MFIKSTLYLTKKTYNWKTGAVIFKIYRNFFRYYHAYPACKVWINFDRWIHFFQKQGIIQKKKKKKKDFP